MTEQEWEDKLDEVQKHSENWYNKWKQSEDKIADLKANFDYVLEGKENEYRAERKELCDEFENMKAGLESQIAILEKENAELKEKCETLEDMLDEGISYQKAKDYDGVVTSLLEQNHLVTKAKEIIKGLLSCCRNYPQENAEKMEQAEQFLFDKE